MRIAVAIAFLACAPGCKHESEPAKTPPLIMVGVDGLEWRLVLQFAADGDLPNLSRLAREGFAARLDTLDPTLSPVIWTTIGTGKRPEKHGITNFSYVGPDQKPHLFLSLHRQSKALWNLFDDAGLTSHVIGWWCTLPVEPIRGSMVAQTSTRAQIDIGAGNRIWKGSFLPVPGIEGQVHPVELAPRMNAIAEAIAAKVDAGEDPFAAAFGKPRAFTPLTEALWNNVRSAYYADCIFRDAALDTLTRGEPCDALLVYFGVTDVASHMFWRHFEPAKFKHPPPADEVADFDDVIRASYRFVDAAIGALERAAPGADLLIVSDHGFHEANMHVDFQSTSTRADSGHHKDQPPGVLIAKGASFRRSPLPGGANIADDLRSVGRVEDVLPTLLARAGLPYGEDMDGRPMRGLLSEELLRANPVTSVKSHEDDAWRSARARARAHALEWERNFEKACGSFTEEELEKLRKIGYVGAGPGLDPDPPPPDPQRDPPDKPPGRPK